MYLQTCSRRSKTRGDSLDFGRHASDVTEPTVCAPLWQKGFEKLAGLVTGYAVYAEIKTKKKTLPEQSVLVLTTREAQEHSIMPHIYIHVPTTPPRH